jgi:hypothetical protein
LLDGTCDAAINLPSLQNRAFIVKVNRFLASDSPQPGGARGRFHGDGTTDAHDPSNPQ